MTIPVAMATSGAQLTQWCKDHNVRGFLGVYCSDNLPVLINPVSSCLIVNHSPCASPSGGSHWLACRIEGHRAQWFDSFGLPPDAPLENKYMGSPSDPPPQFMKWLLKSGVRDVQYNDKDLQSLTSDVCGLYASYFCKYGLPENNKRAWSFLSANKTQNDAVIKQLVRVNRHIH